MIKKILLGLGAIIVTFLIVASFQPEDFKVTRTTTIAAPAPVVFEHFNDLKKWNTWSPWARMDPNCKYTFEGPTAGANAGLSWAGNNEVGEGKMTITESKPNELVVMNLQFFKPFEGVATTEFGFKPAGDQTEVSWTMKGKNNFVGKCFSLVVNCDKMMGSQFEQGFANLKETVAAAPKS